MQDRTPNRTPKLGKNALSRTFLTATLAISLLLYGCAGSNRSVVENVKDKYYSSYECEKLIQTMEYKIDQANLLHTNYNVEDSGRKIVGGTLATAAGVGLASALILTPVGWILAGGLMLAGTGAVVDGLSFDELSDSEKIALGKYTAEYNDMKKLAIEKKCDYYSIPIWDISPEASARAIKRLSKDG